MPATWDPARNVTTDHILPYISSADPSLPAATRTALHTLPFERNVFKLLANSPLFFPPFMSLLGACFSSTKALPPSDWQLAVLLTSRILDAPYEWDVNWPVARLFAGLAPVEETEPKIAARDLRDPSLFTDRQRWIARFCEEVHGPTQMVGEATMRGLQEEAGCSAEEVMELFMITGIYGVLARMMRSAKIDFDEEIPGLEGMLRETFREDIRREEEGRAKREEELKAAVVVAKD